MTDEAMRERATRERATPDGAARDGAGDGTAARGEAGSGESTRRADAPVVRVRGLRVALGGRDVLDGIDLEARRGELLALVGDSGAGKSVLARTLLGAAGDGADVDALSLEVAGVDLRTASSTAVRGLRRAAVGHVPQDALGALDPLRRVGTAFQERLRDLGDRARADRTARARGLLLAAGLPDPDRVLASIPGRLSGGERQRVLIALALAGDPELLIADEPSASLDADLAERTMDALRAQADAGRAVLVVTHDLPLALPRADRVVVLEAGRVIASGAPDAMRASEDSRIVRLLSGMGGGSDRRLGPSATTAPEHPDADHALEGRSLTRTVRVRGRRRAIVADVSLRIDAGESVALLGPSGSGKSSLGRLLLGLDRPDAGDVLVDGVRRRDAHSPAVLRGSVGFVPQDPLGSFDPRQDVAGLLRLARRLGRGRGSLGNGELAGRSERGSRSRASASGGDWLADALAEVGLDASLAARRPLRLSGGQRQRVAIARALAADPRYLVCDEPTSALDASARGRILELLDRLRRERGLGLLVITHDPVVAASADRILRMRDGRLEEAAGAP